MGFYLPVSYFRLIVGRLTAWIKCERDSFSNVVGSEKRAWWRNKLQLQRFRNLKGMVFVFFFPSVNGLDYSYYLYYNRGIM